MKRPGRIRALVALGSVFGLGAFGTWAAYTDTATFTTTFSTGTLDIKIDGSDGPTTAPYAFDDWGVTNMQPGDEKYAELEVSNAGTLDFDYTMAIQGSSVAGSILAPYITTGVAIVPQGQCGTTDWSTLTPSDILVPDGTALADLTFTTPQALGSGDSVYLCFHAKLSQSAESDTDTENTSVTPVVTFTADGTT